MRHSAHLATCFVSAVRLFVVSCPSDAEPTAEPEDVDQEDAATVSAAISLGKIQAQKKLDKHNNNSANDVVTVALWQWRSPLVHRIDRRAAGGG